jgi:hypothetical protein
MKMLSVAAAFEEILDVFFSPSQSSSTMIDIERVKERGVAWAVGQIRRLMQDSALVRREARRT